MPYLTRKTLLASANRVRPLAENAKAFASTATAQSDFDVFLSHSSLDREAVDAVDDLLLGLGFKVYLDRRVDKGLDPQKVDSTTVALLQKRLRQSRCLLVATSSNVVNSKWVPWELGFMDGLRSRVATLPILETPYGTFKGQEYFGVYPEAKPDQEQATQIIVSFADGNSRELRQWFTSAPKLL